MVGGDKIFRRHFFCPFPSWEKITAKTINLKFASKLALEIFYFSAVAFCMTQKA
jgi:hypothetical protein